MLGRHVRTQLVHSLVVVTLSAATLATGCTHTSTTATPAATASRLAETGDWVGAHRAYGEALCGEPTSLAHGLAFAEVWTKLGMPGRIEDGLPRCALDPRVRALIVGLAAAARGKADEADTLFATAEEGASLEIASELAYRRGLTWLRVGEAARARQHLQRAMGQSPGRVELRLALAQAELDTGAFAEVVEVLKGVLVLAPPRADLERAHKLLRQAVRENEPRVSPELEAKLTDWLTAFEQGRLVGGEAQAARAESLQTKTGRVMTVAGLLLLAEGSIAEGSRLLVEASAANPLDPEPMRILGMSLLAADQPAQARGPLMEAVARNPFDATAVRALQRSAAAVGDAKLARDAYAKLVALEPSNAEAHRGLARLQREEGELYVAAQTIARACALAPGDVAAWLERATIETELSLRAKDAADRKQAKQRAHEALAELQRIAPNHPGLAAIQRALSP